MASSSSACPIKLKDPSLWKTQSFINGQWVSGSYAQFKVTDPGNGKHIGSVDELGVKETKQAIESAQAAYKLWNATTAKERYDVLMKLYGLCMANAEDLASIITLENGKPLADAKGEITYGSSFFEWFAGEAVRNYGDVIPSATKNMRNIVIKQGVGVCGLITPWNFPNAMVTRKLAAAVAAGCSVVLKAPSETPFSALALAELTKRAGFPDGLFNVITADKELAAVGKELCENPTVRKISFTGSTRVGKILMSQASTGLKKCSFELGGNAPFIVFDDGDLDAAVDGVIACKFRSSGQTCVCANRVLVQSGVYDEFASRLAKKVKNFKVGYGFDEGVTHGPLIHAAAVKKTEDHVEDAKAKGAQVVSGGKRMEGNYFEPTVLTNVPKEVQISSEETFGPVAALFKFETEDEAIALSNDTEVGLAGYFFSRDIGRIWRVAEALEVGMIGVNTGLISQAQIPFGGVKESGFGREGSKYGLAEYQSIKLIAMGGL